MSTHNLASLPHVRQAYTALDRFARHASACFPTRLNQTTMPATILITGANGQLGSVLQRALRQRYGADRVLATDLQGNHVTGPFERLDATDREALTNIVREHRVTQIYHLAAILSASGEQDPMRTWRINMDAWLNVLEIARQEGIERVFYPSTIAVFGSYAPLRDTPNHVPLNPATVYGMSKAAGENWGQYYHRRYGLDVRSLRYPGVIGHQSLPGGGTTDYAVDIFHRAVRGEAFTCFLAPDERLPMIYMDDAIRATLELMEAPSASITVRTSYNLAGCSLSPAELTGYIQRRLPQFRTEYRPDFRQTIAAGWPDSIDDSLARRDWNWQPKYDCEAIAEDMLSVLTERYRPEPEKLA